MMENQIVKTVVYGLGGFIETEPNNNIIEYIYYTAEELAASKAQAAKDADKAALLAKLGITADEAKLLLS